METEPAAILTRALERSGCNPEARESVLAVLSGIDLPAWFATVDDSPYTLEDWLGAFLGFDRWLDESGITARPAAAMIGYLECCTLTLSPVLPPPAFADLLRENLEHYGFDATRDARTDGE